MVSNASATECSNMSSETESKVQVTIANLLMWKSLIESLLPAVISLFIGPWSDINGRKFLFLASMFGDYIIQFFIIFAVFVWFFVFFGTK